MESELISRLSTLSHPQRMAVFRLLMRRCPNELPAGEIAQVLAIKPSTTSVYLSALTQSGLISQRRDGTKLLYAINLTAAREVVADIFLDCCRGRADLCPPQFSDFLHAATFTRDEKLNVLFVCSGNSARSIIAETLLREMAGEKFNAYSAGIAHRSELNTLAVETLKTNRHDVTLLRSKNISEFQSPDAPRMDFVFTVCDRAANEDCPIWRGQPVSGHWGMPDPVKVPGTDAEKRLAFQQCYDTLRARISTFTALQFDRLDQRMLQARIDEIAKQTAPQG